jgi:hypothetical protein
LNTEHPKGVNKEKAFESALGSNQFYVGGLFSKVKESIKINTVKMLRLELRLCRQEGDGFYEY